MDQKPEICDVLLQIWPSQPVNVKLEQNVNIYE